MLETHQLLKGRCVSSCSALSCRVGRAGAVILLLALLVVDLLHLRHVPHLCMRCSPQSLLSQLKVGTHQAETRNERPKADRREIVTCPVESSLLVALFPIVINPVPFCSGCWFDDCCPLGSACDIWPILCLLWYVKFCSGLYVGSFPQMSFSDPIVFRCWKLLWPWNACCWVWFLFAAWLLLIACCHLL